MQRINVPWGAWKGDVEYPLAMPDGWEITCARMEPHSVLTRDEIERRIQQPLGSAPLAELGRGKRSIGIAIDDIARPTPTQEILEIMVAELAQAGITPDQITVFIASGGHRTALGSEVRLKLGDRLMRELKIAYHFPYENLVDLGKTSAGVPIVTNRGYYECDLHLSVGGLTPHDFAGFGGGYKTVAVGLSGIMPLHHTHIEHIGQMNAGIAKVHDNRFQDYLAETGQRIGIDFAVNVVMTSRRGIADLYAGGVDAAFSAAVASAREAYATPVEPGYDIVVLNAYPKDLDLVQSYMALNVCFFGNEAIARPGGTVVVTTPAPDGAVLHLLGGVGMIGYAVPPPESLQGRNLIICSENLNRHDIATYFPPETEHVSTWDETRDKLLERHGADARVVVVECASLQLVRLGSGAEESDLANLSVAKEV